MTTQGCLPRINANKFNADFKKMLPTFAERKAGFGETFKHASFEVRGPLLLTQRYAKRSLVFHRPTILRLVKINDVPSLRKNREISLASASFTSGGWS